MINKDHHEEDFHDSTSDTAKATLDNTQQDKMSTVYILWVHMQWVYARVYGVCCMAITVGILSCCEYVSTSDSVNFWPIYVFLMMLSIDWNMNEIH